MGQAAAGAGVGPHMLHYILGITKAYTTRVGGGPFPSELDIETENTPGYQMSTKGKEIGTVTKRKRRCGWFDAAALKRSAMINSLSGLCITKLDVLDGIKKIGICVGYELDGKKIEARPAFGLTNAYDIESAGRIRLGFESSLFHSFAVLLQFAAWCVVAFFALVRPRRRSRKNSSTPAIVDAPVLRFVSEDSQ